MTSSNYDVALVINSLVKTNGGFDQHQQTLVLPAAKGNYLFAVRNRSVIPGSRWNGWSVSSWALDDTLDAVTILNEDGDSVQINPLTICGVFFGTDQAGASPADRLLAPPSYGTEGAVFVHGSPTDVAKEVVSYEQGYVAVSHDELHSIWTTAKIPSGVGSRLNRTFGESPRPERKGSHDQSIESWALRRDAFSGSKWAAKMFPVGNAASVYNFTPYDGVAAPAAAGVSVATEERTFDKVYTRPNGESYYGRNIDGIDDVEVLRKGRAGNENVLLFGPPGTGKTALVEAAYEDGIYTVLGTAETETADFVGSYTQRPGEGFVWVDGPLIHAMEEGKVLLVDEIGLIDPKVLSILYSVMDGRGELTITQNPDRGTVKAKEGFYVVAATNPNAPGVTLSEALISRFTIQVEVDSDYALAKHLGVNEKIVRAAELMEAKRRAGTMMWAPQLREVFAFQRNEAIFGLSFAARSMIAGSPEIERDSVAEIVSKCLGQTLTPLRMEG